MARGQRRGTITSAGTSISRRKRHRQVGGHLLADNLRDFDNRRILRILLCCTRPCGSAGNLNRTLRSTFKSLIGILRTSCTSLIGVPNVAPRVTALIALYKRVDHHCRRRRRRLGQRLCDATLVYSCILP